MNIIIKSGEDFKQVKQNILKYLKTKTLEISLSKNSLANLAIHLTIAISRIQGKSYIPLSKSQMAICKNTSYYEIAETICDEIGKQYKIRFPENEISLVVMYLSKNQTLDIAMNSGFDLIDEEVFTILKQAIVAINKKYQKDFTKDDTLFVSMGLHLVPALQRLQTNQMIDNPLTMQIKEKHKMNLHILRF